MITPQGTAVAEVSTGDTVSLQSEAPRSHLDKLVDLGTDELEESWEILMQQLQEMEAQAQATPEQNGTAEAVDVDAELADEASGDLGPTEAEPVED